MPGTKVSFLRRSFARDIDGVTSVEYAIVAGLVSAVIVAGFTVIAANLVSIFQTIANDF